MTKKVKSSNVHFISDMKYAKSERRMRPALDEAENVQCEGQGCVFVLRNICKHSNIQKAMRVKREVMQKYHPQDVKEDMIPEREELYLILPMRALVMDAMRLADVGFELYHIKDVGLIQ